MNRHQALTVIVALIIFGILYFAFDTKPKEQKAIEMSRAENFENTSFNSLLSEGLAVLSENDRIFAEKQLQIAADSSSTELLKEISGWWYEKGMYAIAGHYAEEVALAQNTSEAWSIAGTTFAEGIRTFNSEKDKVYCANHAIQAFENAISLEPDNLSHRLNLAITYTDFPPQDNPMKGIQMLLGLNEDHPDHIPTLLTLSRLGIQTGQYDKAMERLNKIISVDPEETRAYCLLAQIHQALGNAEQEKLMLEKCNL